jgi:hypothetical protein
MASPKSIRLTSTLAAALMVLALVSVPSGAESGRGVSGQMTVDAPPAQVWKVLTTTGNFDDKVKSVNGDEAIVEQKFATLPLMGSATVVVKARVKNMERIDFDMIRSDRLKGFSGSWSISPLSATTTRLHLRMDVDTGLPIPRILVNRFISGKVKNRLRKVKALAESSVRKQ